MGIQKVFYRSPHNYDLEAASDEATIPKDGYGVSLTIQSHSEDADINEIMRRFKITGQLPTNVRVPQYGDFTGVSSYQEALHAIMSAHESFDRMPAGVRARFENDPGKFVDFCNDPANIEDMRKMGLAVEVGNGAGAVEDGSSGSPGAAAAGAGEGVKA